MACSHLNTVTLRKPGLNVTRPTDCAQCFDDQDGEEGIDVCLGEGCFVAGCTRLHAQAHADKFGDAHAIAVNIKRVRRPTQTSPSAKRNSGEPPSKKLAIREEPPENEKYEFKAQLKCYACGGIPIESNAAAHDVIQALLAATTTSKQSDVKAWEQDLQPCQHSKPLVQEASKTLEQSGLAHCSQCELTQNLWLCLTCGSLSCGRQQYGGLGGNGHAVAHYSSTKHPVSVKLGTIQPDGTADIYCYACDDERLDPNLAEHLKNFGIQVESQVKTEKSLTELQVEQNMKFEFAMTGEEGKSLEPLFGPGLTGLRNLGNSCYMASVLQVLFSLPAFSDRYFTKGAAHALLCQTRNPASCFECQMSKIADGLLSGRYSEPRKQDSASNDDATSQAFVPPGSGQTEAEAGQGVLPDQADAHVTFQEGLRPFSFKALVGKDHPEFSTMRQQDSEEFFKYLVSVIQKSSNSTAASATGQTMLDDEGTRDPTDIFKFQMQERLQCNQCKGVRYKTAPEESLSLTVPFVKKTPTTQDVSMTGSGEGDAKGKAAIEGPGAPSAAESAPADAANADYEQVGLEECLRLLTSNVDIEYKCPKCNTNVTAAKATKFETFPETLVVQAKKFTLVNWVPQKVDVPLIIPQEDLVLDDYLGLGQQANETELPEAESSSSPEIQFNEGAMAQLEGMGFPAVRCQKALLATGNSDPEAAMNWLFAHMEDADIDAPIPPEQLVATTSASTAGAQALPSSDSIALVSEMGFSADQARKALRESGGNVEAAVEWLFSHPEDQGISEEALLSSAQASAGTSSHEVEKRGSNALPAKYRLKAFISHKGNSIHVGHYVAHIKVPGVGWVLFNDEKVVKADGGAQSAAQLMPFAYLYFFEKVQDEEMTA